MEVKRTLQFQKRHLVEFKENRMGRWFIQMSKHSMFWDQFDQGTLTQFNSANIYLCLPGPQCCFERGSEEGRTREQGGEGEDA